MNINNTTSCAHNVSTSLLHTKLVQPANRRSETIISESQPNLLSKMVLEARVQQQMKKKLAQKACREEANDIKRKIWEAQTEINNLKKDQLASQYALKAAEEQGDSTAEEVRAERKKLKEEVMEVKQSRVDAFHLLLVFRHIFSAFKPEVEELEKKLKQGEH